MNTIDKINQDEKITISGWYTTKLYKDYPI